MSDDIKPENSPANSAQSINPQPGSSSVGVGNKEALVMAQPEVPKRPEDYKIPQEVVDAGVVENKEQAPLDKTHFDAGITHSDPPHPSVVSQSQIKVPLSEAEARVQDANPDKTRSQTWWGGLILKAIRKAFTKQSGPNTPIPNPI
ncbi:MAG: hypothetical protein AAB675_02460 [Patescibacteria group bacterium]